MGIQDESRGAFERQDMQTPESVKGIPGEQLPLELKGGLFGREQNQRPTFRRMNQLGADFGETAVCLAAAGGTEQEVDLHAAFFHAKPGGRKGFISSGRITLVIP